MPIIFICEDNGTGISVPTDINWIEQNFSNSYGMEYIQTEGLHILDLIEKARSAEKICRLNREPVFLHMRTVRLMGHAGSDVEVGYRTIQEIEESERNDPLVHSARILIENNCLSKDDIIKYYESVRRQVSHVFDTVVSLSLIHI